MFKITSKGDFKNTVNFLNRLKNKQIYTDLQAYGEMGVAALSKATPIDTGEVALNWHYRIINDRRRVRIDWYNTDTTPQGTPIAVLIQYGHATGNGGYVVGRDFINPTLRPIFDQIADEVWKKVKAP